MELQINQDNYNFLTRTLANLGFGTECNEVLRTKMSLGLENFKMIAEKDTTEKEFTRFTINLEKGQKPEYRDRHFLNRIKGVKTNKETGEMVTAEFKVFKQNGFNIKEMENLLSGRPVYREKNLNGENDPKWYSVDIANPVDGIAPINAYPDSVTRMNLDREIDKLNIIWKHSNERKEALDSLREGNRIYASARHEGKIQAITFEVSPQISAGLAVLNKEGDVIKYTNAQTQSMRIVNEDEVLQSNQQTTTQTSGFKVVDAGAENGKITETTKQVMEAANKTGKENTNTHSRKHTA